MNQHDMNLVLQDVRKAYILLADYQQRVIELINYIKKNLNAEHYCYNMPHSFHWSSFDRIYNPANNIGWDFLPMIDLKILWHKTKNVPDGEEWQNNVQQGDLVFVINIASNENKNGELSAIESKSELYIYIYQCLKYKRKRNWHDDVWLPSEKNHLKFKEIIPYKDRTGEIEYHIYGERLDLSQMYDEEGVKELLDAFRQRASAKLGQKI
jgi:uncharacterized protein PM0109